MDVHGYPYRQSMDIQIIRGCYLMDIVGLSLDINGLRMAINGLSCTSLECSAQHFLCFRCGDVGRGGVSFSLTIEHFDGNLAELCG